MAPRKDVDSAAPENIKALCVLMSSCVEFTPDLNAVAKAIGIAQPKNVPRKINTIIEPVGYTMKKGKVIKLEAPAPMPSVSKSSTAPTKAAANSEDDEDDDAAAATTTPATNKRATRSKKAAAESSSPSKRPATKGSSKKRKMDDAIEEQSVSSNANNKEDSPATKAIKEIMDGSENDRSITPTDDDYDEI